MPPGGCDLGAQESGLAAEAHGADPQRVCLLHDRVFEPGEHGRVVPLIESSEQHLLGDEEAGRPVTPDADPENARGASFALRPEHGIQDTFPHPVEISARIELGAGQGVLGAHVLGAAPFEHHADSGGGIGRGEMDLRHVRAYIVARIFPGHRIHAVVSEEPCFRERLQTPPDGRLDSGHVRDRAGPDEDQRHPGVLADRESGLGGERGALKYHTQGLAGDRIFALAGVRQGKRAVHVIGQHGAGLLHEGRDAAEKIGLIHHFSEHISQSLPDFQGNPMRPVIIFRTARAGRAGFCGRNPSPLLQVASCISASVLMFAKVTAGSVNCRIVFSGMIRVSTPERRSNIRNAFF